MYVCKISVKQKHNFNINPQEETLVYYLLLKGSSAGGLSRCCQRYDYKCILFLKHTQSLI